MPELSPALLELGLTSPLRQLDEATQVTDSNVKWPPHERGFSPLRPPLHPVPPTTKTWRALSVSPACDPKQRRLRVAGRVVGS